MKKKIPAFLTKNIATRLNELANDIAINALDEFDENFERQGFFKKNDWKKSDNKKRGGSTLIGKGSGRLRRSLYIKQADSRKIEIAADGVPYAAIHNAGGKIKITEKMRGWAWSQHYKKNKSKKKRKQMSMHKAIAITKKTHLIIPKRQFLGHHPILTTQTEDLIKKEFSNFFR